MAYDFDGAATKIEIDDVLTNELANTTVGSWSAWVKPTVGIPGSIKKILSFGDTDADSRLEIYILSTTGTFLAVAREAGTNQWVIDTDTSPFVDNVWTHIAIVQDGTSPVLYIDGVAVAQAFITDTDKTFWFNDIAGLDNGRIGAENNDSTGDNNFFDGSISDVRIYNYALSPTQIQQMYNREYNLLAK